MFYDSCTQLKASDPLLLVSDMTHAYKEVLTFNKDTAIQKRKNI